MTNHINNLLMPGIRISFEPVMKEFLEAGVDMRQFMETIGLTLKGNQYYTTPEYTGVKHPIVVRILYFIIDYLHMG